jgi:RNA polymerase primary sigma factor
MPSVSPEQPSRGTSLSRYLRDISGYAPDEAGDGHSRITGNLGFVVQVARQYVNRGLPLEDLLAEGNLGLLEAAKRYDPRRGAKFITYAVWWIRKTILKALSEQVTLLRVPHSQTRKVRTVRETERALSRDLGRRVERDDISRRLRLPIATIDSILLLKGFEMSLDDATGPDGEIPVCDRLPDSRSPNPEAELLRRECRAVVHQALRHLEERERSIVVDRFGLRDGRVRTLRDIGREHGMSREAIRLIETRAMKRLRRAIERERLKRSQAAGRETRKVVPEPGRLSTSIDPPIAWVRCLAIASPRPVPPSRRSRDRLTR